MEVARVAPNAVVGGSSRGQHPPTSDYLPAVDRVLDPLEGKRVHLTAFPLSHFADSKLAAFRPVRGGVRGRSRSGR